MDTNMHGGKTVAGNTQNDDGRLGSLWKRPAWITALILLIPFLGNNFVDGWNWPLGAFILAGTFLFGTSLTYELVTRKADTIAHRAAVGVALAATLLLVWMNGAVEIIGDDNPANLMYFGVPIVGIIGAALARFRTYGMAHALFATALAQASVPVIALIIWNPGVNSWAPGVVPVFGLNAFLVTLFVVSALLFR
ncbi:MAG: hypothetical protein ACE1ZA_07890, partial [Pseudomonadales bacterium]